MINSVGINDYLQSVVACEVGNSYPLETQKAQAIAARTYLYRNAGKYSAYDIVDTTNDQVYKGVVNAPNCTAAVEATNNLILTYNGSAIWAFYSSSNGGKTYKASQGFSSVADQPYLVEKTDSYDPGPKYGHGVGMSQVGARNRAYDGHNYSQILGFYFPGCKLYNTSTGATTDLETPPDGGIDGGGGNETPISSGTVTASVLNIRKSASTSSMVIGSLQKGATVQIVAQEGDWYKINYGSGTGYVHKDYVQVGGSSGGGNEGGSGGGTATQTATVTASALNVRQSASTSSSVIGTVRKGQTVNVTKKVSDSWYEIEYGNGVGYVHGSYITLNGSSGGNEGGGNVIQTGTVTASSLNVRKTPSTSGARLGGLSKGATVNIVGTSGDWYQINYGSGTAYVHKDYVQVGGSGGGNEGGSGGGTAAQTATVTASALNVRRSASTSSGVMGTVRKGQTVEVVQKVNDTWYQINYNGSTGYVHGSYISINGGSSSGGSGGGSVATSGTAVVTANVLNVRSSASTSSSVIGTLQKNKTIELVQKVSDSWYQIKFGSGTGYVHASYIRITDGSGGTSGGSGTMTVTASSLYVRSGPSTSSSAIGGLRKGQTVTVLGSEGAWYKISFNGRTAYIHGDYVR
nr:SH3 domain-containing protein [Gehongia tenuis]